MTYNEALEYLYSFIDYSIKRRYRYSPDVFELDRVRDLLSRLGNPHQQYRSVHVAGTKGKGSTSAMIAAALSAAGYRTGLYSSPHLMHFTERMRINGQDISQDDFARVVFEIKPFVAEVEGLTTYEIATAAMFLHFAQQQVDFAVVEVGLGGRLDATNVLQPEVNVITSLSYDHMHLLGNSLSDIAREKAGIIKPGIPVVLAPQQHEAERTVAGVARAQGSEIIRLSQDWHFSTGTQDLNGQTLYVWSEAERPLMKLHIDSGGGEEWMPPRYEIPLLGYHQVINCAVARVTLAVLQRKFPDITEDAIRTGFKQVRWPGRFDVLNTDPIIIVDSAHNRDSALRLRIALDDYFPSQNVILLFGASADKDIHGMYTDLLPRISRLIATRADHPRAADPADLARMARSFGVHAEELACVDLAMDRALEMVRPDEIILVAGSIFIAGEVLNYWEQRKPDSVTL